jgi:hypothetical protein
MPGLAFPPVGRLGLTSPPSQVLRSATTATCPSCWPVLPLGHQYLVCSVSSCPFFKLVNAQERLRQRLACLVTRYTVSGGLTRRQMALPSSQVTPFKRMPRSSTPVVSSALAFTHSGLLPSAHLTASAFPAPTTSRYPSSTILQISRLYHAACALASPGFGLPLPVLPAGFASDLLARLWSSGICTHWVTLTNFYRLTPISQRSGLSWRNKCLLGAVWLTMRV